MIKRISVFILTLMIVLSLSVPVFAVNSESVVDYADLMTDEEEQALQTKLNDIYEKQQFDVAVVTISSTEGKSDEAYADDFYDYNGYGYGGDGDGCLLLIRVSSDTDRYVHISTKGYGITALTDYGIQYIIDDIKPSLKEGEYYKAADRFADDVDSFVTEAKEGKPFDVQHQKKNSFASVGIAFVIALIVSLIITFSVKKSYKPVHFNRGAANYLVDGTLNVKSAYDNFLYSNVTRTKIETDSSGGGSSTHTSSSGSTHGGGGSSF